MRPSSLWTLGVCLVALGLAAHWFGWDALLWFPRAALAWVTWAPAAIIGAIEESPSTVGLIALGIVLMVVAKIWMRPTGGG
ncbi:MAG: hypothetical protein JWR00_522 [Rubritepida sp.]|nr:hypothetical protein [Rubritepida sp.]